MLELLKSLCALDGVTGTEQNVRDYIRERVRPYAERIEEDAIGNLIVYKKGAKSTEKKLMLAAHMDEVGVIITGITDDGYLKFACAGGIDRRVLLGKQVYIGESRVYGVIGNKAIHLVKSEERNKIPKVDDMFIDIGANSRADAEKLVSLGDTGAFDNEVFEYGNRFLKAKAIDDRVGCAVLIKLIEQSLPVDCIFVFTVQEEVGTRGVRGAAFRVKPDVALIVEGTTAADLPSVEGVKKICRSGAGVVIPFMDRGTIYDKKLYRLLNDLADENNIPHQTKTVIAGGTDGSAVQRSRGGVQCAGIAVPVRNIHSPASCANVDDCLNLYKLADAFVTKMGEML